MNIKGLLIFVFCIAASLTLSFEIDALYCNSASFLREGTSVITKILGESRNIASNMAFLQADLYYHRGVGHFKDDHQGACAIMDVHHEHAGHKDLKNDDLGEFRSSLDPLSAISKELEIVSHSHMENEDLREIAPWLYYAHKLDPDNISGYVITSYYLANRFGKVPEAVALLRKGIARIPDSWELYAEMGVVQYKNVGDPKAAIRFLERAAGLLEKSPHNKFDERMVFTLLADACSKEENYDKALEALQRMAELFPGSQQLQLKISELKETIYTQDAAGKL